MVRWKRRRTNSWRYRKFYEVDSFAKSTLLASWRFCLYQVQGSTVGRTGKVENGREPGAHQEVEVPLDLEEEDLYPFLDTQFII